jgi:hypothetical protein
LVHKKLTKCTARLFDGDRNAKRGLEMRLMSTDETDELRRLALQIAIQLPACVEDARLVLAMAGECLDNFLIDAPTPMQRAKRLGWRLDAAATDQVAPAPAPAWVATRLRRLAARLWL